MRMFPFRQHGAVFQPILEDIVAKYATDCLTDDLFQTVHLDFSSDLSFYMLLL